MAMRRPEAYLAGSLIGLPPLLVVLVLALALAAPTIATASNERQWRPVRAWPP